MQGLISNQQKFCLEAAVKRLIKAVSAWLFGYAIRVFKKKKLWTGFIFYPI
jgi:hypothetical protein